MTTPPGWTRVVLGESGAEVYRRADGAAYAKRVPRERVDELDAERRRIEWLAATVVAGPRVIEWTVSDDAGWLTTTAVPGRPASELSAADLLRAWPSIVETLRELHELPVEDCPFDWRLARLFPIAADVVSRGAVNPDFLTAEQRGVDPEALLAGLRAELDERTRQEAGDLVVCHGDACLPNLMVDPDSLTCTGLIDLGRLGVADRHVDLAVLRANARETWKDGDEDEADRLLADGYGADRLDPERMRFYLELDPLTWPT